MLKECAIRADRGHCEGAGTSRCELSVTSSPQSALDLNNKFWNHNLKHTSPAFALHASKIYNRDQHAESRHMLAECRESCKKRSDNEFFKVPTMTNDDDDHPLHSIQPSLLNL